MEVHHRGPGHRESHIQDSNGGTTSGDNINSTWLEGVWLAADTQHVQR